jgi:hypothetical protein
MSQVPEEYREPPDHLGGVTPNPSSAKTIGVLNVIFASILLLCGICSGMQLALQSTFVPIFGGQQQQIQAQVQAQRALEIQKLADKEKTAKNENEKQKFQAERKNLEAQPVPKMPDMTKMYGTDNPRVLNTWLIDTFTAVILNLLMLASGVGLLMVKEWGRVLGIWVAGLKIVRLVAIYVFMIVVIVPFVSQRFGQTVDEMNRNMPAQGGGAPAGQVAAFMGTFMTIGAVSMIVLGAIYPAICLIVLTRASVKAACRQQLSDEELDS